MNPGAMKKTLLTISVLLSLAATSCLDINSGNTDPRISLFPNTKFPFSVTIDYTFANELDADIVTEPVYMEYELGENSRLADYLGDSAAFMDISMHAFADNGTGASFKLQLSAYGIGGIEGNDCSSDEILIAAGSKNVPIDFTFSRQLPFSSIDRIGLRLVPVSGKVHASEKISCSCEHFTTANGIVFGN